VTCGGPKPRPVPPKIKPADRAPGSSAGSLRKRTTCCGRDRILFLVIGGGPWRAGIASPLARMVTLQKLEKPLNQIANWVLDRVIGK
jgi:hypothetical protein